MLEWPTVSITLINGQPETYIWLLKPLRVTQTIEAAASFWRLALCGHGLCCFAFSFRFNVLLNLRRYIPTCKAGNLFRTQFWSREARKKSGVLGAFHQRRPLPPHGPFPLSFFCCRVCPSSFCPSCLSFCSFLLC